MFKISDVFTLSAVAISFATFGASYFSGVKARALLTTISALGTYFKHSMPVARGAKT